MDIGRQIAHLRKQKKISQEDLAEQLNVSRQAVSKWETGQCNPDTENLIRLAEILQVDIVSLVGDANASAQVEVNQSGRNGTKVVIILLSVLLILTTSVAIVFALLWQGIFVPSAGVEPTEPISTESSHWDDVKMYINKGTLRDEIPLTENDQAVLDKIWQFTYSNQESSENDEPIYGGLCIEVEFHKNAERYVWSFTHQGISLRVYSGISTAKIYSYEADINILTWLETFL